MAPKLCIWGASANRPDRLNMLTGPATHDLTTMVPVRRPRVLVAGARHASWLLGLQKGGADGKPVTDQWLAPFVIEEGGKPVGTIEDGDAVVRRAFPCNMLHCLDLAPCDLRGHDLVGVLIPPCLP